MLDDGRYAADGEGKWSFVDEFFKSRELRGRAKADPDFLSDFCRWIGEGRLRQGTDVRLLTRIVGNPDAEMRLRTGAPRTAFAEAKSLMARADPSIDSDFFKLLAKVRDAVTNVGQVMEILRIRTDQVARDQITLTHQVLGDFMRLADVEPTVPRAPKQAAERREAPRPRRRQAKKVAVLRRHKQGRQKK